MLGRVPVFPPVDLVDAVVPADTVRAGEVVVAVVFGVADGDRVSSTTGGGVVEVVAEVESLEVKRGVSEGLVAVVVVAVVVEV